MTCFSLRSIHVAAILVMLGLQAHAGPYYLVIASFSNEAAARKFQSSSKAVFQNAAVRFDAARRLYHLHVLESNSFDAVEKFRLHLTTWSGFEHAWILTDFHGTKNTPVDSSSASPVRLELYTGQTVLLSSANSSHFGISKGMGEAKRERNFQMPFTFFAKTRTGVSIPGKVTLMTSDGHLISESKTNETVYFSGQYAKQSLTVIFQAQGFNPETRVIEFSTLGRMRDCYQNGDGAWEVLFRVSKTRADGIPLVFKTVFEDDAAVFRPESKTALDILVSMAKLNPGWRIIINTHCNAGGKRSIKLPGKNFFQISEAHERVGSDKFLTRERAIVLRDYLVQEGIDANRISDFAWGSLNLLVKDGGKDANNERVEVELIISEH